MQQPEELSARPKAEAFRIFGLNDQILADLAAMGFHQPTPIQTEALPVAISGKDMIGQALGTTISESGSRHTWHASQLFLNALRRAGHLKGK